MPKPKKPKKPLIIRLKNSIYPHTVVFYVGSRPDDRALGRLARRVGLWTGEGRTPTAGSGGAGTMSFGSGSIVWLDPDNDRFMAHFSHEMVHVLNNLADQIGEKQDYLHDELFAYYAGWLAHEFFKRFRVRMP